MAEDIRCVAVLGGTGWVGRHLCAAFAARGARVVVLARNPVPGVAGDRFVPVDLATAPAARTAAVLGEESVDVVVNATDAANATDGWERSDADLAAGNVGLVERLLLAVRSQRRPPRLVHIGTMHEYGQVPVGRAIDEGVPPRPESVYARTKLAGSEAVLGAGGVVLRAVNVCGPHPSPASLPGKLLALLAEAVHSGVLRLPIADARRDWVDVRDLADAAVRAATSPGLTGVVNVGGGRAVPMVEFVETFVAAAGLPTSIVENTAEPVASYGGAWVLADTGRAERELGWRPTTSLAESLRSTWETHLQSRGLPA